MLDDILLHCQNTSTLEAAYALLKTLSSNAKFSGALESGSSMLDEILEDMGFGGLWRSCSTRHGDGVDKQSVYLTEKLIEVCCFSGSRAPVHVEISGDKNCTDFS